MIPPPAFKNFFFGFFHKTLLPNAAEKKVAG